MNVALLGIVDRASYAPLTPRTPFYPLCDGLRHWWVEETQEHFVIGQFSVRAEADIAE